MRLLWASVLLFSQGIAVVRVLRVLWQLRNTFAARKRSKLIGPAQRKESLLTLMLLTGNRAEHFSARTLTHAGFDLANAMRHDMPITVYSNTYKHMDKHIHVGGGRQLHVSDNINNFILAKSWRNAKINGSSWRRRSRRSKWAGRVPSNCWQLLCMSQKVIIK